MPRFVNHRSTAPEAYEARRSGHFHRRRVDIVVAGLTSAGSSPHHVVELGCGTGAVLHDVAAALPSSQFWGIDLESPLISYAQEKYPGANVTWMVGGGPHVAGQRFDAAYSIDVLHHVPDQAGFFREVRAAMADGGRWVIVEPNVFHPYITWLQGAMKRSGLDEDHFRPWRALPLLRAAGFRVCSRRYAHLFPATVKRVSPGLARVERTTERVPVLGGSLVLVVAPD